jgi:outer membrane protein assembly factor BamB
VFVGDAGSGLFVALTCRGERRWSITAGTRIIGSTALAYDGTVFVGTFGGSRPGVLALRSDGTFAWDPRLPVTGARNVSDVVGSPAIDAIGRVYVGTTDQTRSAPCSASIPMATCFPITRLASAV